MEIIWGILCKQSFISKASFHKSFLQHRVWMCFHIGKSSLPLTRDSSETLMDLSLQIKNYL